MIVTAQDYYKQLSLFLNDEVERLEKALLTGVPVDQYQLKVNLRRYLISIRDEAASLIKKAHNA